MEMERKVSASDFVMAGWGFERFSGMPVDRVDVSYQDYDGGWHQVKTTEFYFGYWLRYDVMTAYRPYYPNVPATTGWSLKVIGVPPGLRRIHVNVWRGPYYEPHERTYLITQ
jgi:hypothetical protein